MAQNAVAIDSGASAGSAPLDSLQAPCTSPSSSKGAQCNLGLRSCTRMKRASTSPNASFADRQRGVLDNLDQMVDLKLKYYYQGLDIDLFSTTDSAHPQGSPFPPPVCNVVEGEIEKADPNSNHPGIGNSCGEWSDFSGSSYFATNGKGDRERAYMRGGQMQALKCFKAQVEQEIDSQNALNVNSCAAVARDIQSEIDIAKAQGSKLSGLCSSAETGSMDYCDERWISSEDPEANRHRQAACQLQSVRQNLESAFARTGFCEITQRARTSWINHLQSINDYIKSNGADPCLQWAKNGQCAKHISFVFFSIDFDDPDCLTRQFKACYHGKTSLPGYPGALKQILQKLYPDSGKCQSKADLREASWS